jgi:hypothetical protein
VQQTQQNYKTLCALLWALLVVSGAAQGGIKAHRAPEPLLHDGAAGPCDPRLAGPDYVPGVDVTGNPVAPADLDGRKNPVPDSVLVPLAKGSRTGRSGESPVVAIDGRMLDPILNPPPGCAPARH